MARKMKPGEKKVAVITITVTRSGAFGGADEFTAYTDFNLKAPYFQIKDQRVRKNVLHNACIAAHADIRDKIPG